MLDPREYAPAAWGLAGALAYGFWSVIQAFRIPGAAPGARTKALADLAFGAFVGPLASTVFSAGLVWAFPRFDARAVQVGLGVVAVPGFSRFVTYLLDKLPKDGGAA